MKPLLASLLVLLTAACATADDPVLHFPTSGVPARLRLEVTAGGKAPDAAWVAFLDKLFTHFDRNGDGFLSTAESARVFPLPLPDGAEVKADFAKLDADNDGKATPAEFRTFYRSRGFTPVVVVVQPAPLTTLGLGAALFHHLDRDRDGKLSADELRHAPALLRRLDEDEDEVITAAELVSGWTTGAKPAGLRLAPPVEPAPAEAVLRISVSDSRVSLADERQAFRLAPDGSRLTTPGGVCTVSVTPDDPTAGYRAAKAFYLAQFQAAAGDKPATRKVFEDDAATQALAGLFDAADRDGDAKLTQAELEAFFDLVELGVGCRVVVTATDRGRNLFDLFDVNADGRLDLGELSRAARTLPGELVRDRPLTPAAVPASYRLSVGRGPVGESFGPVPFGAATKPKPQVRLAAAQGPRWFRSMDRNGDGFVSPREFVGPPELFQKIDTDGDGRISPEEAEKAAASWGRGSWPAG